jgi:catechol 2,3-dioxygenase-like lactoylglutathione lyase family enzyme
MTSTVDRLFDQHDRGMIGRRQLLAALLLLPAADRSAEAQTTDAISRGTILNHVTLSVSDVVAAKGFYQRLFGATVQKELPNQVDLRIGDSFITVLASKQPPGIMHFCVGVEQFGGEALLARLQSAYPQTKPRLVTNELGQQQIILRDPDGITAEISDPKYRL